MASGLCLCTLLMGVCPVLRAGFVGFGSQAIHGMFFLPDVGIKKKNYLILLWKPHIGNQCTFSCCWGTVLLEAKNA